MDKIEISEYIRTKKGNIAKVCAYQDLTTYDNKDIRVTFHSFDTDKGAIADIEIAKHSKDIKKLVEAGDYVNGLEVYKGRVANGEEKLLVRGHLIHGMSLEVVDIKSILTKEQYKQNCYKVEVKDE